MGQMEKVTMERIYARVYKICQGSKKDRLYGVMENGCLTDGRLSSAKMNSEHTHIHTHMHTLA